MLHDVDTRYPWREMQQGDQFMFRPSVSHKDATTMARQAELRTGARFEVKLTSGGLMCKRVDDGYVRRVKLGRPFKYPWWSIEVGESFKMTSSNRNANRVSVSLINSKNKQQFQLIGDNKVRRVK